MKTRLRANTRNHVNKKDVEDSKLITLKGEEIMLGHVVWVRVHSGSWWPAQVVNEDMVSGNIKPKKKLVGEILVRLYGTYTYLYVNPMKYRSEFEDILKQNNGSYRETFLKALEQDISQSKSRRLTRDSKLRETTIAEASKNKMSKQDGTKKTKAVDGSSSQHSNLGNQSEGRAMRSRTRKVVRVAENSNGDASRNGKTNQDSVKKISKEDNTRISEKSHPGKQLVSTRTGVKRGDLSLDKVGVEASKSGTPKQDGIRKRHKSISLSPGTHTSEKSPNPSVRRIKVMQSLGLVAPYGSPFNRNGFMLPSL